MGDLTGGNNFQTIENCYVAANSSENLSWQPKIDTTKYYHYSPQGYEFEYLGGFMGFCGSSNSPGSVTIENNLFLYLMGSKKILLNQIEDIYIDLDIQAMNLMILIMHTVLVVKE